MVIEVAMVIEQVKSLDAERIEHLRSLIRQCFGFSDVRGPKASEPTTTKAREMACRGLVSAGESDQRRKKSPEPQSAPAEHSLRPPVFHRSGFRPAWPYAWGLAGECNELCPEGR